MNRQVVVLLDHEAGAARLSAPLRALGLDVVCVSRSPRSAGDSDVYVASTESIPELAAAIQNAVGPARIVGVYTVAENSKFRQLSLNQEMGLHGDGFETVVGGRDKSRMRRLFEAAGLATHDWYFLADGETAGPARLAFPLVCKPNLGFASGGVRVVRDQAQYEKALAEIRRLNRLLLRSRSPVDTGVVVEEYLPGPEYALDATTWRGTTKLYCCCGKKYPEGNELIDFAYFAPAAIELHPAFQEIAAECATTLHYQYGPTHTEVRWDERRRRWQVLETALRVGFMGHIGTMIAETTGTDYNTLALLSALRHEGAKLLFERPVAPPRQLGLVFSPEVRGKGRFGGVVGLDSLRQDPRVRSIAVIPEQGDWVSPDGFNYCVILVAVLSDLYDLDAFLSETSRKTIVTYI